MTQLDLFDVGTRAPRPRRRKSAGAVVRVPRGGWTTGPHLGDLKVGDVVEYWPKASVRDGAPRPTPVEIVSVGEDNDGFTKIIGRSWETDRRVILRTSARLRRYWSLAAGIPQAEIRRRESAKLQARIADLDRMTKPKRKRSARKARTVPTYQPKQTEREYDAQLAKAGLTMDQMFQADYATS